MDIDFQQLKPADIEVLSDVMTRAFDQDAQQFQGQNTGGPPGYDDGSFLRQWGLDNPDSHAYRISVDGCPAGAFILWWDSAASTLGNIFIDPVYQNLGVGLAAWRFIEATFPAQKWRLETPEWATRNHYFYHTKCGFRRVGVVDAQVQFEKVWVD